MKKILVLLLVLLLTFSLAACSSGNDNPEDMKPSENGNDADLKASDTKLNEVLSQLSDTYFIEMQMQEDIDGNLVTVSAKSAVKDDLVMSETIYPDAHIITIYKDNIEYTIMPEQKTYMKTSLEEDVSANVFDPQIDLNKGNISAGKEEIDGVIYDYEDVDLDGISERYYFDDQGRWVYLGTQEQHIKIVSYGKDVDDSWFEIPSDYTETSAL